VLRAPSRDTLIEEHREIMKAALKGDIKEASDLLAEHYRKSVAIVMGIDAIFSDDGRRMIERGKPLDT
jgi:DNA-binding GntR family transcriptional regulator